MKGQEPSGKPSGEEAVNNLFNHAVYLLFLSALFGTEANLAEAVNYVGTVAAVLS